MKLNKESMEYIEAKFKKELNLAQSILDIKIKSAYQSNAFKQQAYPDISSARIEYIERLISEKVSLYIQAYKRERLVIDQSDYDQIIKELSDLVQSHINLIGNYYSNALSGLAPHEAKGYEDKLERGYKRSLEDARIELNLAISEMKLDEKENRAAMEAAGQVDKSKVFVGSSTEGAVTTRAVKNELDQAVKQQTPRSNGQVLETLLGSFSCAIKSGGPEECAQQFEIWMGRVKSTLAAAGMNKELHIWEEEMNKVTFYPEEDSFPAQAESMKAILIAMFSKPGNSYIDIDRINELRKIQSDRFNLAKLITLCEEINICWDNRCYFAVASLLRAILDHIPPIFGFDTFPKVANNYTGGKSFKECMLNLDQSSRKIADSHLHSQIQRQEVLPNSVQVNFSNNLDVLLVAILKALGEKDAGSA